MKDLDAALHVERRIPRSPLGSGKRAHRARLGSLPTGAMVDLDGVAWLVADDRLLRWTSHGYDHVASLDPDRPVWVLTPPTTVGVLRGGYAPTLHHTAAPE